MAAGRTEERYCVGEDWDDFVERLQLSFVTKEWLGDAAADKCRAHLLTSCGPKTYALMKDLLAPEKPVDKTFEELSKLIGEHLKPASSVHMARRRFYTHRCREGQSIPDFVADLRRLASLCKFTDACSGEILRDFFFKGIGHAGIFRKLIETKDLTLEAAALMAQTFMVGKEETKMIYARNFAPNTAMDQGVNIIKVTQHPSGRQGQSDTSQAAIDPRVGFPQRRWQAERTFTPSQWTMRPGMGPLTPTNRVLKSSQRDIQRGMPGHSSFVPNNGNFNSCWRCGGKHSARSCRFQQFVCRNCNLPGH
uniref:uncharacterized protein n=1 Tax=Pristiophorus japonicus TaxID=55135 RepID=UPI00398E55A3